MKWKLHLIALLLTLPAWAQEHMGEWVRATTPTTRGAVLAIHGLNFSAEGMRPLATLFAARGYDVYLLTLAGHERGQPRMGQVSNEIWLQQVRDAYAVVAQRRAEISEGKLVLLAFSLGGLLSLDLVNSPDPAERLRFDSMMLFAPAIAVHPAARAVQFLRFMPNFVIPSLSPQEYRANNGTTVAAYSALIHSLHRLHRNFGTPETDVPATVFISPRDELVSIDGIRALVERAQLRNWTIVEVDHSGSALTQVYRHLLTDPRALGQQEWDRRVLPVIDSF
jgi:alpha-beta hydrolase superfamily lysophospholipase